MVITSNWIEHGHICCLKEWALYSVSPLLLKAQKKEFLYQLVTVAQMEEIPVALILNWDQTGYRFVSSPSLIMDKKGVKRVEMVGQREKQQIAAVWCGSLEDDFLPIFN